MLRHSDKKAALQDFPSETIPGRTPHLLPGGHILSTGDLRCLAGEMPDVANATFGSSTWPAINRAIYSPFVLEDPITVYQIAWENGGAVSGTLDVGIYDENFARIYGWAAAHSDTGITQTGLSQIQLADIADTTLRPGLYYMAMSVDNTTAALIRTAAGAIILRVCGVYQEALGSVVLPVTATPAAPASPYMPYMALASRAVV